MDQWSRRQFVQGAGVAGLALVAGRGRLPEWAPWPAVLWRQGWFGSDSTSGSHFAEQLLTVAATCWQQGRPLVDFLVAAGEAAHLGTAPPSLLPAPAGR
jgi:hypothetical protein